ncbi:MAG: cbb3-type cytochrome c oxidase subunit I, partial [Chloroflexota bacterium]
MATTALHPAARTYRSTLYEWVTTTDHKKIGVMYLINSFLFFFIGGLLALGVRSELAQPGLQFVTDQVYNELFTMHATFMIFLFIIPILAGFGNFIVPLHIGAPDVAFPRINALSLWLLPMAGLLLLLSFFTGQAPAAGWTSYSPLAQDRPLGAVGPGQDLWIVAVVLVGTSSILGAVNFLVTIFKMRAPGMTLFRMPIMVWTVLVTSVLGLLATPVLTSALIMLFIDRNYGGAFFDPRNGGDAILYQNVFWFYSHPAVYIMAVPGLGAILEIVPVFARKPLFAYPLAVLAFVMIGVMSFMVWAHHMFVSGMATFFHIPIMLTTELISVPTGVVFLTALGTIWMGRIHFKTPMLWVFGFLWAFLIGGITGVYLADVPTDIVLSDTFFVVAHFHYTIIGATIYGLFAGTYYWFPKITGRMYDERLGKIHFWWFTIAFNLT